MKIADLDFEILWGNPTRLKAGGFNINTSVVIAADMFSLAAWSLAVGMQLLKVETETPKNLEGEKNDAETYKT